MQNGSRWKNGTLETSAPSLSAVFSPLRNLHGAANLRLSELPTFKRRAERDRQLINAGDQTPPLLTIVSGWAFRYNLLPDGRRQIVSISLTGDTIGLDTLLTGAPSLPVQCATPVVYTTISYEQFGRVMQDLPSFRNRALRILGEQRAAAELALTRMGQCSAEERVAATLLEFYERLAARKLAANNSFALALTQQALADLIGMTAVHLNRVVNRFKARKLIAVDGHQVTLLDMASLRRLVLLPSYTGRASELINLL